MARSETPDYNPDREGHRKHKFIVQPAWKSGMKKKGINLPDGRFAKYNREKRFMLNDEKMARDVQKEHRNDLVVTRVNDPDIADRGHNYFFGQIPEMPWKRIAREKEEREGSGEGFNE